MALPTPPQRSIGKTYARKASKMIRTFFITNDSDSIVIKFDNETHPFSTKLHKLQVDSGGAFTSSVPTTFNGTVNFNFDQNTIFDVEYPTVKIGANNGSSTKFNFGSSVSEDSDTSMIIDGTTDIHGAVYFRPLSEVFISADSLNTPFNNEVAFNAAISIDSDLSGGSVFDSEITGTTLNVINLRGGDAEGDNEHFGDSTSGHGLFLGSQEIVFNAAKNLTICGVTGTYDSDILLPNGLATQFFDIRN